MLIWGFTTGLLFTYFSSSSYFFSQVFFGYVKTKDFMLFAIAY